MQRSSGLPLYVCEPPQAVCWARVSTSNFKETDKNKDCERKGSTVNNYKEALTEGWHKGLKK